MHHALEIQEILADIFCHCGKRSDLSSLARTCHTFKEPALDALWKDLQDLRPLVRCAREESHKLSPFEDSFHRPFTRAEWDVFGRYAPRIRSIKRPFIQDLDEKFLGIFANPPTTEPLFPNLRLLKCTCRDAVHLLRFPHPSLLSVHLGIDDSFHYINPSNLNDFLHSVPQLCPNIRQAHFEFLHRCLDAAAIEHLSRIGGLTRLRFALDASPQYFDPPLVFSDLQDMWVHSSWSWNSVSQFLCHIRLPAITVLGINALRCPSHLELSSFFTSVQKSGVSSTIDVLHVLQPRNNLHDPELLGLDDLRPCIVFRNLCRINIDIAWDVGLTDEDLLALTPAWPGLKMLSINQFWGWNTMGGITPNGLLRLLQTCPSLRNMALAVDTRDYVEVAPWPESLGPTLPRPFLLDVVDSIIEEQSVPFLVAFFARIASLPGFYLHVKKCENVHRWPDWGVHARRWNEVRERAEDTISRRSGCPSPRPA